MKQFTRNDLPKIIRIGGSDETLEGVMQDLAEAGLSEHAGEDMVRSAMLKAAKKEARNAMKHKLSRINEVDVRTQSEKLFTAVCEFRPYISARRLSIYLSMPTGEVSTDAIVRHALESGKEVFVPYIYASPVPTGPKKIMDMVRLNDVADYEGLERDDWGIPSLSAEGIESRERVPHQNLDVGAGSNLGLDLMLLPGMAFQRDENAVKRLGHGKGFYDYFLSRYELAYRQAAERTEMGLYALALEEQYLEDNTEVLPTGPDDYPLSGLLVGDGRVIDLASKPPSEPL